MSGTHREATRSRSASTLGRRRPWTPQEWEQTNRLGLLLIHALVGLLSGLVILFNGTAAIFDQYGDWVRPVTGGSAFLGGAVLAAGLARHSRRMTLEIVGLFFLTLWELVMAGGFALALLSAGVIVVDWPWRVFSDLPSERLYPVVIFLGLALMTSLHLWTASRVRLPPRLLAS